MKAFSKPVSASMIHCWQNCPRAFYYSYILKLKKEVVSANLPFGSCVHTATTGHIIARAKNISFDRNKVFREAWDKAAKEEPMEFSSKWDHDSMGATGARLVDLFADAWDKQNLFPLFDANGEPLVEQPLRATLPNGIEIYGIQDFAGMDLDANVAVVDIKTPGKESPEGFVAVADQPTLYQILNEANKDALGIEQVDKLGFFEMVKQKIPKTSKGKGPHIAEVDWVPRRSNLEIEEFCDKVEWMVDDINRGRFPKTPRMAWNSACDLCDFKGLCQNNDNSGLIAKPSRQQAA